MSLRNRFVLPFALSIVAVLAGCGSNSPHVIPPPSGGFSNSNLNGTYVISTAGIDVNNAFLTTVGTITANGSGGITGGTLDVNDADTNPVFQLFSTAIKSGNYSISSDGRGKANIETTLSTFTFDFVLSSDSHGLITEFDGSGSGSGTIDVQSGTVTQSQLAQGYAFQLSGADVNENPVAAAGAFTLGSDGTISSATGVYDLNDGGTVLPDQPLTTGSMTLGSGGGSGTGQLQTALGTLDFNFYVIDATHLKIIQTDALGSTNSFLSGDVFQQAAMPSGTLVFTMAGENGTGPFAAGGFMTASGAGVGSNGLEDVNNAGTVPGVQVPFTLSYSTTTNGRATLGLGGFSGGPSSLAVYPTTGGLLMLDIDGAALASGVAFAQTATALATPPQGYGLNFSGANLNGPFQIDDIAEFQTASDGTMTGILDENDQGTPQQPQTITNTSVFQQDSPVTGRGEAQFNDGTSLTYATIDFYTVDGTNTIFIDVDPTQVAVGSFQMQSGTATPAARPGPLTMVRMPVIHGAKLRRPAIKK
jgi:hypothetical protein